MVLSFPRSLSCFIRVLFPFYWYSSFSFILCPHLFQLLLQRFAVTPLWSRCSGLTMPVQSSQNKCNISRLCFNNGWLCYVKNKHVFHIFKRCFGMPLILSILFLISYFFWGSISTIFQPLIIIAEIVNIRKQKASFLHSISIHSPDCCQCSEADSSWLKMCTIPHNHSTVITGPITLFSCVFHVPKIY